MLGRSPWKTKYMLMQKYQQLAVETREERPGYAVEVVTVIIRCLVQCREDGLSCGKIDRTRKECHTNSEDNETNNFQKERQ